MYMRLRGDAGRVVSEQKRSPLERRQGGGGGGGGGSVNYVATIIVSCSLLCPSCD